MAEWSGSTLLQKTVCGGQADGIAFGPQAGNDAHGQIGEVRSFPKWFAGVDIHGLAHITGGGLIDNPPRIFPDGLGAKLNLGSWPILPIFNLIQQLGSIPDAEMHHVFNMGLGMLVIVSPEQAALVKKTLGDDVYEVGEMVEGRKIVTIL